MRGNSFAFDLHRDPVPSDSASPAPLRNSPRISADRHDQIFRLYENLGNFRDAPRFDFTTMPRSPIRRPSADLDLSYHLITKDSLPEFITSQTLFKNDAPLELEIGSGKGLFLTNEAIRVPEHNFLGIEIIAKYAKHAAARMVKAERKHEDNLSEFELRNARMYSGDAQPILESRIPAGCLEAVHVYFPDPWWKKRHRKRRVVNHQSVQNIFRALSGGGRFHFWTDVLDYFESTIEMIAEITPEFGVPIPEEEIESTHDLDFRTHFERRSRQNQIPVYRVRYEKRT